MNEGYDKAAGQGLRWWQDTTTTIPPVGGIAARTHVQHTELDPVLPDIGHELE